MKLISGETRECTWLAAVEHLANKAKGGLEYNLILEVKKPSQSTPEAVAIRHDLDELLKRANKYSVHTVAETIFPATLYKKHGLKGVYDIYPNEVFPTLKKCKGNNKGTYAYRIVRGKDQHGKDCNPLEKIVDRMKGQLNRAGGIRCAFDMSIDEVDTIPINRNDSFIQGFPCLSHLSFKLSADRETLHLTAIYRSQDFIQKALGNLLGLARLQSCVAREVGVKVGTLVCHATLARLDTHTGIGNKQISNMIDSHRELFDECG